MANTGGLWHMRADNQADCLVITLAPGISTRPGGPDPRFDLDVHFTRASDGEVTDFRKVVDISGEEHVRLLIDPGFRQPFVPVCLPAGTFWCESSTSLRKGYGNRPTFLCQDHPEFREEDWRRAQYFCAAGIWRRNATGELIPFEFDESDGPLFRQPE